MSNRQIRAYLLDMDGVLYHGTQVLPGAVRFMQALADKPFVFVTNNPIATPQALAQRLSAMGLGEYPPERFITSASATAAYLQRQTPGYRFFAVGEKGLHVALQKYGEPDAQKADYVVVGEGAGLDYVQLTQGINLVLKSGAKLVSTNPDATVDAVAGGVHRILPGGGALVAPFEVACGCKAITIGKPAAALYTMAIQQLGVGASACVMVGDRPDTDILGAQRLGMQTALVRTGRFAPGAPLPAELEPPTWDVADLDALLAIWTDQAAR